jgi:hypothetical protein
MPYKILQSAKPSDLIMALRSANTRLFAISAHMASTSAIPVYLGACVHIIVACIEDATDLKSFVMLHLA